MKRNLGIAVALYLPHLVEEALTGMHDDSPIVAAYAQLASLGPRHAAYLIFQLTFALGLAIAALAARGGAALRAVVIALAFALVGEGHHIVRALLTASYNPGLVTGLPMPFIGGWILYDLRVAADFPQR